MVTNPRTETSRTKSAADVSVKPGNNSEGSQPANLQPRHLAGEGDQDIGAFGLGQFHAPQPKVLPFQPQLPAPTSVKFR